MSVENLLAQYNVTMGQARDFLSANVTNPQLILDVASEYGLSFAALGEIAGISTSAVQEYFVNANLSPTATALARIGVTPGEAQVIVDDALGSAKFVEIFEGAKSWGLTVHDLGNVSKNWTVEDIEIGLRLAGLNPAEIGGTALTPETPTKPLINIIFLSLATQTGIMGPNTNSGALSTESLRDSVLSKGVSAQAYDAFFSPSNYAYGTSDDGRDTINMNQLGELGSPPTIAPATKETLESYFYGMAIKALQSVDASEQLQLGNFLAKYPTVEPEQMSDWLSLLTYAFKTPAATPAYSNEALATAITDMTVVHVTGAASTSAFFDIGLFSA